MGEPEPRRDTSDQQRWAEVRALAEAALALPADARGNFLDMSCPGDPGLRAEVEAQVRACDSAASDEFLADPAAARAAPLFAEDGQVREAPPPDAPTDPWPAMDAALSAALEGRYAVERALVRGGSATVYAARDSRHGRRVALKVLEPALGAGMSTERFLREIRVTAGLTHPHILPLHDSGEAAGLLYYVMPLVEGETLRQRLAREGALPVDETLRVLREVTDALAYAHGRGVVHRDIKPANILLHGGHALVADFGIARALRSAQEPQDPGAGDAPARHAFGGTSDTLTAEGISPGTPAYMAPEQASGGAVDERADLYALGVVAYEMLAGVHPFAGGSPRELIAAHLAATPPPLAARRPTVPPALAALVMRLLAKNPAERPPSAQAVLQALDGMRGTPPARAVARRRLLVTLAVLAFAGAGGGFLVWRKHAVSGPEPAGATPAGTPAAAGAVHALAVLPFVNTSGDAQDDYFSDGLTDELAHALAQLRGLRIAGRTSSYAFKGKAVAAQEVGRALGVDALVEGTVQRSGERVRVTAQLVSAADGTVRWDSVYETRQRDAFALEDALTRAIVAALAPALGGRTEEAPDVARGTADEEAYELFLKGRYNFLLRNPTRLLRSIQDFQQAIARDPGFARAHAGLAMAYSVLPIYFPGADSGMALATASARRAVALDSSLADAQLALGSAYELQVRFPEAVAHYQAALARDPTSMTGHFWLGFTLTNMGRNDEALVQLRQATQLDPLAHSAAAAVAVTLLFARRFPEAVAAARAALAIDSSFWGATWPLGMALAFGGHADSAVTTYENGLRLHPGNPTLSASLVFAYAAAGRWADAARLRDRLHRPGADPTGGVATAIADLVFADREPALRLLTTDEGRRRWYGSGSLLGCNPLLDPLRNDPRFRAAMRQASIEPCPVARPWPLRPPSAAAAPRR